MRIYNGLSIKTETPDQISKKDLLDIYKIEQDTWANLIGEYLVCKSCSKYFSKKDIYGFLPKNIYKKTVYDIEKILGLRKFFCHYCDSEMEHLWGKQYINEILSRFGSSKYFLTTVRNHLGIIVGFSDGYISDIDSIYSKEFSIYYGEEGLMKLKNNIKKTLNCLLPEDFLMCSSICISPIFSSMKLFLYIMEEFYNNLKNQGYENIIGIYESNIKSKSEVVYSDSGAIRLGISTGINTNISNINNKYVSDVFLHPNIVNSFIDYIKNKIRVLQTDNLKI